MLINGCIIFKIYHMVWSIEKIFYEHSPLINTVRILVWTIQLVKSPMAVLCLLDQCQIFEEFADLMGIWSKRNMTLNMLVVGVIVRYAILCSIMPFMPNFCNMVCRLYWNIHRVYFHKDLSWSSVSDDWLIWYCTRKKASVILQTSLTKV